MSLNAKLMIYGKPRTNGSLVDYDFLFVDTEVPQYVKDQFKGLCRNFAWNQNSNSQWNPVVAARHFEFQGGLLFVRILDIGKDSGNRPHTMVFQGAFIEAARERASNPEDLCRLANPEGWQITEQPHRLELIENQKYSDLSSLATIRVAKDWNFFGDTQSFTFRSQSNPQTDDSTKDAVSTPNVTKRKWLANLTLAAFFVSGLGNLYLASRTKTLSEQNALLAKGNKDLKFAIEAKKEKDDKSGYLEHIANLISDKEQIQNQLEKKTTDYNDLNNQFDVKRDELTRNADQSLKQENNSLRLENKALQKIVSDIGTMISKYNADKKMSGADKATQPSLNFLKSKLPFGESKEDPGHTPNSK